MLEDFDDFEDITERRSVQLSLDLIDNMQDKRIDVERVLLQQSYDDFFEQPKVVRIPSKRNSSKSNLLKTKKTKKQSLDSWGHVCCEDDTTKKRAKKPANK